MIGGKELLPKSQPVFSLNVNHADLKGYLLAQAVPFLNSQKAAFTPESISFVDSLTEVMARSDLSDTRIDVPLDFLQTIFTSNDPQLEAPRYFIHEAINQELRNQVGALFNLPFTLSDAETRTQTIEDAKLVIGRVTNQLEVFKQLKPLIEPTIANLRSETDSEYQKLFVKSYDNWQNAKRKLLTLQESAQEDYERVICFGRDTFRNEDWLKYASRCT